MPAKHWETGLETALVDSQGHLLEVNPALHRLLQGSPSSLGECIHPEDWSGLKAGQTRVRMLPSGTPWDLTLIPLPEGWLAQFQAPSDLLRDFHHRAKNNLAVISSLLQLQANLMADPLVKRAFRGASNVWPCSTIKWTRSTASSTSRCILPNF